MARSALAGGSKSLARTAFEHYLRTGLVMPAEVEHKLNPNHDPDNGQFTSGAGGASSRRASRRNSLGPVRIVKLTPLSDSDESVVNGLLATRSVADAMDEAAVNSGKTGKENGFFIYYDGDKYYPGKTVTGIDGDMTDSLYYSQ